MSEVILYDYWRSSASYRVRVALNLKGLSYLARPVDLLSGAHRSEAHLQRNPQGLLPVLDIDGLQLTQSLAIIEYLEETRPGPALLPRSAGERARVRALAAAIASDIHPVCNLSVVAHVETLVGAGQETKVAWMRHFISAGLEAFEKLLEREGTGRFCHGDQPGLADICLRPQLYNAQRWGVDCSQLTHVNRIAQECDGLEAFKRAHPDQIGPPPKVE